MQRATLAAELMQALVSPDVSHCGAAAACLTVANQVWGATKPWLLNTCHPPPELPEALCRALEAPGFVEAAEALDAAHIVIAIQCALTGSDAQHAAVLPRCLPHIVREAQIAASADVSGSKARSHAQMVAGMLDMATWGVDNAQPELLYKAGLLRTTAVLLNHLASEMCGSQPLAAAPQAHAHINLRTPGAYASASGMNVCSALRAVSGIWDQGSSRPSDLEPLAALIMPNAAVVLQHCIDAAVHMILPRPDEQHNPHVLQPRANTARVPAAAAGCGSAAIGCRRC